MELHSVTGRRLRAFELVSVTNGVLPSSHPGVSKLLLCTYTFTERKGFECVAVCEQFVGLRTFLRLTFGVEYVDV